VVLFGGRDNLVAGMPVQAPNGDVHTLDRIMNQNDLVDVGAEQTPKTNTKIVEQGKILFEKDLEVRSSLNKLPLGLNGDRPNCSPRQRAGGAGVEVSKLLEDGELLPNRGETRGKRRHR